MKFQITDETVAKAVVDKALEYEAIIDREENVLHQSNEVMTFCAEAWTRDGVQPSNTDPEIANMGRAIKEIFDIAGFDPAALS